MFKNYIDNKKLGGVNWLIWKDGKVVQEEYLGYRNLDTHDPMTPDTIFRIASMTKPVTSVLTMKLWEEKKLNLEDPITNWFPQFRNMKILKQSGELEDANRLITILDLLTHRAGFTYSGFQSGKLREDYKKAIGADIDPDLSYEQWLNGLVSLPLVNQPGELFNYGRGTDMLGILISRIEGKPLGKVMEEKIFDPLGIRDTSFTVPINKRDRICSNIGFDESGNVANIEFVPGKMALNVRPENFEFESGGQGLWSTIGDYLKFARLFVEDGSSNGVQILKKETIELMCKDQLTAFQRANAKMFMPLFREDHGFGLGLGVVLKESKYGSIPCSGSVGSVGWPGAYGGWWSADPARKVISIFLTHSMTDPKQLAQGIGLEVYEAIDIFSNYSKTII